MYMHIIYAYFLKSYLIQYAYFFFSFLDLFPGYFLSLSDSNFQCVGLQNRCLRMEVLQKSIVHGNRCQRISGLFFSFLHALGTVFLIFWASKTSWKTTRFLTKNQIHRTGSGEADPRVFGPS